MALARARRAAGGRLVPTLLELGHEFPHACGIDLKLGRRRVDSTRQNRHWAPSPRRLPFRPPERNGGSAPLCLQKSPFGTGTIGVLPRFASTVPPRRTQTGALREPTPGAAVIDGYRRKASA